jgi:glycosyltransferase involved in cell wall biosynthesis
MKPANVLIIRDSSGIYGSERVILTLASRISKEEFHMHLLCFRRGDGKSEPLISLGKKLGIDVVPVDVSGRFDLNAICAIRSVIKERDISIVHSHDFKSNFYAVLASADLHLVRVATAHGSTRDSLKKNVYLMLDEWLMYRFFDKIIIVSYRLSPELERKHLGKGKIAIIQNGLDLNLPVYQQEYDEPVLPVRHDSFVFAVIGRLFPDKGHKYFLEAFSLARRKHPSITGLIIGDGPERAHIEKMILGMGLGDMVHLCGVRSDMNYVYRNIDCLVIPSLTEGLPYVLLEAMTNGIPVLATSVGDIPLLVRNQSTGYLVPPADSCALARSMVDVMEDPRGSEQMAWKGRQLVMEYYSADKMVKQTEDLYFDLMPKKLNLNSTHIFQRV